MPELPEIETVRTALEPVLAGKTIESAEVRNPKMTVHRTAQEFSELVSGKTVESLSRRGKILVWNLDGGDRIVFHFRMTGQMAVAPPGWGEIKHVRLVMDLGDGCRMQFGDQRKFARVWFLRPGDGDDTGMGSLGPEPDDPSLDWRYLRDSLGNSRRAVKTALLDQTVVAGLGNIYTDEILFGARVNPLIPCAGITVPQWKRIAAQIPETISLAIEKNRMSPEEFLSRSGTWYRDPEGLNAYARAGKPCVRCGTPMERSSVGGRSACWCPKCQKMRRRNRSDPAF